jgi:hypothetical protein
MNKMANGRAMDEQRVDANGHKDTVGTLGEVEMGKGPEQSLVSLEEGKVPHCLLSL